MDNNNNNNPPHSSSDNTATTTNPNNRDHFLRHLNKLSHKISKPPTSSSSHFKPPSLDPPPPPPPPPPQQQQPPVYNINKSDFRDVVQKLTGSPAHATSSPQPPPPPPPIHAPKPASSRLQRIRPPPLIQLTSRPPPLLNSVVNPHSPLPPLPTCHAAAESPISAYMRFLHNSTVDSSFNRAAQMLPPPAPPQTAADYSGFTWLPSPKSPCPLLSPNLIFSPTGNGALGFPQLPPSPTVSGVPSPK